MKRREFIAGLGGAAALPLVARAQQARLPSIGYLSALEEAADRDFLTEYRRSLGEEGYLEGRNIEILYRYGAQADRLSALAQGLARNRVSVFSVFGGPSQVEAAKTASPTTPIVFATGVDPVEAGLVASLNRPGGNITGVTALSSEVTAKNFELLHDVVPTARTIGLLTGGLITPGLARIGEAQEAARILGVRLVAAHAQSPGDVDAALQTLAAQQIEALVVSFQSTLAVAMPQIVAFAARHRLPAIYRDRAFVRAGGLMSYGGVFGEVWRIAGAYTGRILKGEKPGNLPVQQSSRLKFAINLKTAKALGLTVPQSILLRADEVIE
jgi:putative tryptophan/tyrosine transport system substrate-binding protein